VYLNADLTIYTTPESKDNAMKYRELFLLIQRFAYESAGYKCFPATEASDGYKRIRNVALNRFSGG
jgi:hypothetical protein